MRTSLDMPVTTKTNQPKAPVLSLILCSRNDRYMGNSIWRLETTLNYVAKRVHELGREADVEVLIADWGSEIQLKDVLHLTTAASKIVSFVRIPPEIARHLQKDSPFPEVLALNAAARRAQGEYIGRIDQDTLVGRRFLKTFFELYERRTQLEVPLNSALLFSNLRMVPYRFAVQCPSLCTVERFIDCFGQHLNIDLPHRRPFYEHGVGIWLLHRNLWNGSGGYDERMIYMNDMEINMIFRLMQRYRLVNLGKLVDCDFYHLEHYHPRVPRKSSTYRKVNPLSHKQPDVFHPNTEDWGLANYCFKVEPCSVNPGIAEVHSLSTSAADFIVFWPLVLFSGAQMAFDSVLNSVFSAYLVWIHRGKVAWETVRRQPILSWPHLLQKRWIEGGPRE